jgi:hypothetical protein
LMTELENSSACEERAPSPTVEAKHSAAGPVAPV